MVVADASVLIVLAKTEKLEVLKEVYGQVVIGPIVKREVLEQGKAIAAPGVERIEKAVEDGWIGLVRLTAKEESLMRRIVRTSRLHEGEAESLAMASSRSLMVIVDDKEARAVAATMRLEFLGTAGVLLEALLRGVLTLEELEEAVKDLSRVMWLSPSVVTEILKRARKANA